MLNLTVTQNGWFPIVVLVAFSGSGSGSRLKCDTIGGKIWNPNRYKK